MNNCEACEKITKNIKFCHNCLITLHKYNMTEKDLISFKNIKEIYISDILELSVLCIGQYTKIYFNCEVCEKLSSISLKPLKNYKNLICSSCRIKQTSLEKYGVDNPSKSEIIISKIENVISQKYGVKSAFQLKHTRELRKESSFKSSMNIVNTKLKDYSEIIEIERNNNKRFRELNIKCKCSKCGVEYITTTRRTQRCPKCFKEDWTNGTSLLEKQVLYYIQSIYQGTIISNDRKILKGKELDIYLPELKIAIEVDGDYWHSYHNLEDIEEYKLKVGYKQTECYSLGIHLITVKEFIWNEKNTAIKNFLKNIIQKPIYRKVRKLSCTVQEIKKFQDEYSLISYNETHKHIALGDTDIKCVITIENNICIDISYKENYRISNIKDYMNFPFKKDLMYYSGTQNVKPSMIRNIEYPIFNCGYNLSEK